MASHCRLWDYSISSYIEVQPRRLGIYGALDVVELESFRKTPWQMIKQVASPKIALPYNYHAHMASYGWWFDQGQTLAHFKDHLQLDFIWRMRNILNNPITIMAPNDILEPMSIFVMRINVSHIIFQSTLNF